MDREHGKGTTRVDDVNWQASAELRQIGVEDVTRGTLEGCVRAYCTLPEADRSGAMILCDELVAPIDGRPAAKSIEGIDLARPADRLPG